MEIFDIKSPREIYATALKEVDGLFQSLEAQEVEDEDIRKTQQEAQRKLRNSQQRINESVSQLKKNSEWDVFTIAFYGETNAGKSTLIETLRILLKEPKKMSERQIFDQKIKEKDVIASEIKEIEPCIDKEKLKYQNELSGIDVKLSKISAKLQEDSEQKQLIEAKINQLNSATHDEKKLEEENLKHKAEFSGIDAKISEISMKLQERLEQKQLIEAKINQLNSSIQDEKESSTLNFFRYFFKKLPSQKAIKDTTNEMQENEKCIQEDMNLQTELLQERKRLSYELLQKAIKDATNEMQENEKCIQEDMNLQTELLQERDRINNEFKECINKLLEKQKELECKANECLKQIEENADGRIIGDGRSDFTRDLVSYQFKVNNEKFALLDVPGIEGNEKKVLNKINQAVQKAHVVFYVTHKTTPPQTADKTDGTLEKIKKHLGQQTEVYTIFNKRAPNPRMLEFNNDNLKALDEIMRKELGEQYGRLITLSAYPAFLAIANCWHKYKDAKNKFIEYFKSAEQLLCKTEVDKFSEQLTTNIVSNCIAKIKKSNYTKIFNVIDSTAKEIGQIHKDFISLRKQLIEREKSTNTELDKSVEILKIDLKNESNKEVEKFKRYIRNRIYTDIDKEIDNDKFKMALKKYTKESINNLRTDLENDFKSKLDKFKNDVSDIIKKHQRDAEELLEAYTRLGKFDTNFELNIDINSGINWKKAGVAIYGIILAIFTETIWPIIIAAVVIGLVSFVKAVWGFFDNEYRKSQQRKAVEENISKKADEITKNIRKNLSESNISLDSEISEIKKELKKMISHIDIIIEIMAKSKSELTQLAKSIKTEGGK